MLQNGNHALIDRWRREKSLENTYRKRPDMLDAAPLTEADRRYLRELEERDRQAAEKDGYPERED